MDYCHQWEKKRNYKYKTAPRAFLELVITQYHDSIESFILPQTTDMVLSIEEKQLKELFFCPKLTKLALCDLEVLASDKHLSLEQIKTKLRKSMMAIGQDGEDDDDDDDDDDDEDLDDDVDDALDREMFGFSKKKTMKLEAPPLQLSPTKTLNLEELVLPSRISFHISQVFKWTPNLKTVIFVAFYSIFS